MQQELLEITMTLSQAFNCSPFEIMAQDVSEVILVINFYIQKANTSSQIENVKNKNSVNRKGWIKVNDKTATGGWF